jgi:hypothetical protein
MTVDITSLKSGFIECPKCQRDSRKLVVEMDRVDWRSVFLIGVLAAVMFPSNHRKEFQCEHCGNIFLPKPNPVDKSSRLIGILLGSFSILMVVLVIMLLRSHQN